MYISVGGASAALAASATATVSKTGWPRFDAGPLASVSGAKRPSFELLTFIYQVTATTGDDDDDAEDDASGHEFTGVVAVDESGWVVWYYQSGYGAYGGLPQVWDFLPASQNYSMVLLEVGYDKGWKADDDAAPYWKANSVLLQVSADGALEHQYVQACSGSPLNFNQLTHEMRVDHTSPDLRVLVTRSKMKMLPNVTVNVRTGRDTTSSSRENRFGGVEIAAWHRADGTLQPLYDLWDYASPDDADWNPTTTTWTEQHAITCQAYASNDDAASGALTPLAAGDDDDDGSGSGSRGDGAAAAAAANASNSSRGATASDDDDRFGVSVSAVDYHHVSSVSVGLDGDLLVSSRNLNTVWCFDAVGDGSLKWTVSTSNPSASDYAFERALDAFYTPHDVLMLGDGRLLLIDDGSSRPGCTEGSDYAGCWSRAVLYAFDDAESKLKLQWQFEDPRGLHNWSGDDYWADGADAANASAYFKAEVETRDLYNWDGGSAARLASERLLVAFTSPYDSRIWDQKYAMVAYEVDLDGDVLVTIVVPHSSDSLKHQGSYRFLPMRTVAGESTSPPISISTARRR